jgi:hypothetical protein
VTTLTLPLWPTTLAIFLGIALIGFVIYIVRKQQADPLPEKLPDSDARQKAAEDLWKLYPAFPDEQPDTALFLLEESKSAYNSWIETNGKIEKKATWLTGFLAGGAGLLAAFGKIPGENDGGQIEPFLILSLLAATGSLIACFYILRPKLRPHPSTNDYVSPAVAISPMSRFHLALSLAEGYNQATLQIARLRRYDPIAWTAAQASLTTAVCAILAHFLLKLLGHQG